MHIIAAKKFEFPVMPIKVKKKVNICQKQQNLLIRQICHMTKIIRSSV
jgi:hypothetical protein